MLREVIGIPAMLEQYGEELAELIQASYKLIRKKKGENLTPKTMEECMNNFIEEMSDIFVCSMELLEFDDYGEFKKEFSRDFSIVIADADEYDSVEYNMLMSIISASTDLLNTMNTYAYMIRELKVNIKSIKNDPVKYRVLYDRIKSLTFLLYEIIDIYQVNDNVIDSIIYKQSRMEKRLDEYNSFGTCSE